jgi:hypothetical protein
MRDFVQISQKRQGVFKMFYDKGDRPEDSIEVYGSDMLLYTSDDGYDSDMVILPLCGIAGCEKDAVTRSADGLTLLCENHKSVTSHVDRD